MEKDSRTKLIEAATSLFAKRGFTAVSIRELAETAGVNSALISYHFGGKEGLYEAVLEANFSRIAEAISAAEKMQLTPEARIRYYTKAVNVLHKQNPFLIRLLHTELTNPTACFETVIKKYLSQAYSFIYKSFAEGVASGYFSPTLDPAYAAISLAGIMNFYFIAKPLAQNFLPAAEDLDESYLNQALSIYLNGVRRINYE
ncbi:HTH-type transcriptional regulator BetI [Sporomusa carbonis]|uniref:TetR/AcrR family transcriptional regulator n=1 Tax=Sporomusa carbonis TaxID=3076075 RepID=UPI003A6DF1E8